VVAAEFVLTRSTKAKKSSRPSGSFQTFCGSPRGVVRARKCIYKQCDQFSCHFLVDLDRLATLRSRLTVVGSEGCQVQQARPVRPVKHVVEAVDFRFMGANRLGAFRERTYASHSSTLAVERAEDA
jgi:hypothetical protein